MILIADFSKTFTNPDMPTTWSVFAKGGILGLTYTADRNTLFEKYSHYEKEGNIDMTEQWFLEHAQLLAKYHLTEAQIDSIVLDDRFFAPRQGVREFLQAIDSNNITLIIVSSGLTPCIARWFKLRFDYVPEIIIANDLIIEEGKVVGVHKDSVICPLDKTIELESDKENHDIILLGDALEDMSIVENPSRTLGFTDEDGFDVRLGRDASMEKALEYLYL